jgi:hypothetical protein
MKDSQAMATDAPDIGALQTLFTSCSPLAHGWNRLRDNDNTRYTRWDGQSADGRKWSRNLPEGQTAFPHEGASDCRIPLADEVINDCVDYLTEGFWRSMARVAGNPETERSGQAAYARKLLEWVKGTKLYSELVEEIELHAQNGCTYGSSLLQVGWERQLGYRHHEIQMADLLAAASGPARQREQMQNFVGMVLDPALDEDSAALLQSLHAAYVRSSRASDEDWEVQELSAARARRAIRELRAEGKAKLPLPYLCKDEPFIRARKLWEDVFIPDTAVHIQKAPAIFVVDLYTEAELRARARAEEWNAKWVEEAVRHAGEFSEFTDVERLQGSRVAVLDSQFGISQVANADLIEVVTAYRKQVDEDGVMGVYETVFHAQVTRSPHGKKDLYARHGLCENPIGTNYPFVQWRWEVNARPITASRGIPEIVATWQRNVKVQEDGMIDRTTWENLPPILVEQVMGVNYIFGPAVQVPVQRGKAKPEFMTIPTGGKTGFEMIERIEARTDRYYGRPRPDMDPAVALVKRQKRVRSFLLSCSQALSYCFKLMTQNMAPEQIEKLTGMNPGSFGNPDDIADDMLYLLTFDVQEMTPDFVQAKNKALVEISAMDSTGTIDRAKLTRHLLRAVDPSLEAEIATDVQGAQGQVLKLVKDDFANMLLGVPAPPVENDPTSPMQLQFAQQLIEVSPKYQMAMKQDPHFAQLVQDWVKNRQFSLMQMQNKQIGRVGVDMNQPQAA